MPNRVVHFEIHAENPERCAEFYTKIFGWKITKLDFGGINYWSVETGPKEEPGINGGIVKRIGSAPAPGAPVFGYACTLQVESYDETVAKLEAAGSMCALRKFPIPGMAWQGYYIDTEGNIFGIHQMDPNAK